MKYILTILFLVVTQLSYGQHHEQDHNDHHHHGDCLPIDLIEFTAVTKTNSIKVIWSTETETDNDYFSIYRSPNGYEYFRIATIQGAGTTHLPRNYEFIDDCLKGKLDIKLWCDSHFELEVVQRTKCSYFDIYLVFCQMCRNIIWKEGL